MWADRWLRRVDPIYRRDQLEDEIDEEMRFHIERRMEENLHRGMTPREARRAALARFGDRESYKQACRVVHRIPTPREEGETSMSTLLRDVSYAFRNLVKSPGFTLVAVVTLALGIGANTAIFSVVDTVLLHPLPYDSPQELYIVWGFHPEIGTEVASLPDYFDWRDQNDVFEGLAATFRRSVNLTGEGQPERLIAARVTANLFPLLRVEPALGRAFHPEEDRVGGDKVAILSHGLWQRRFGGRTEVVGQTIELDGEPHTVVGVAPAGFELPSASDLWLPLALEPGQKGRRSDFLFVLGRLAPGVTAARAQSTMDTIARRLEEQYPDTNAKWGVKVESLLEQAVANVRPTLWALWAAVGFVLLIACANVANLLLSRAVSRDDLAVRAALGAGRLRLLRQLLTESALLFLLGGLGGLALGYAGIRLLVALEPGDVPRIDHLALDARVAAFTLGLALVTGLLFGLAPALHAVRHDLFDQLREGGRRAAGGRGGHWTRNALVVSEIGLSLVLLAGAGLMIKSLHGLQRVEPGFATDNVLTMRLSLPRAKYQEEAQIRAFFDGLLERVAGLPGVRSAAVIDGLFIAGGAPYLSFGIEGAPTPPPGTVVDAQVRAMTPSLYETLEIPIVEGEAFGDQHGPGGQRVALVNQALARRYFPDVDPIGRRVAYTGGPEGPDWRTIIGVVADVKQEGLDVDVYPEIHVSASQQVRSAMTLVVRTQGEPSGLIDAIRAEVQAMDADQPIYGVQTMEQALSRSLGKQRFAMVLFSVFAAVALILAAVGIYGVMSYSVGQRTREIGVRMAMGARPLDVLGLVVGKGVTLTLCGLALGLAAALYLTRFLATLLYRVTTTDPLAFSAVAGVLAAVALLACLLPAWRAMRIDPVDAVRYE